MELLLLVLENCIRVNQGDPEDGAQVGGVGGGDGEGQFEVFGWRGCWKDGGEAWVAVVEEKQVARQVIWPKEVARSKASISPVGKSLVEGDSLLTYPRPPPRCWQGSPETWMSWMSTAILSCWTSSPKACVKLKLESHDLDDELLTGNNKSEKIK